MHHSMQMLGAQLYFLFIFFSLGESGVAPSSIVLLIHISADCARLERHSISIEPFGDRSAWPEGFVSTNYGLGANDLNIVNSNSSIPGTSI